MTDVNLIETDPVILQHRESKPVVVSGRTGNVSFKPYDDIFRRKKRCRAGEERSTDEVSSSGGEVTSDLSRTVDHLYPELLCLIFRHLDVESKGRVAQVCVKWRNAVYSKSVWKGLTARLHLKRSNPTVYPSLVLRGVQRVQVLSLRKSIRELVVGMPRIQVLDLSGCYNLSDAVLDTGFNRDLPDLRSINLSLCKKVTDNSLGRIATHCKNLENLDLGGCTKITNTGLLLISLGLKSLRSLNLRSCWQITDTGISHLAGLDGKARDAQPPLVLETLVLQDCQKLSDDALGFLSRGLPTLRRINLSFCASITDTGMISLARLAAVEELNLRFCDNISDIGVGYLAEGSLGLHALDLSFCDRVTDGALAHIASGLFNLKSLAMASCMVQDEGMAKLAKTLLDLDTLNVGQCSRITDRTLICLADNLRKLRSIDLYGCSNVSAAGINYLRERLNLSNINTGLWLQTEA